MEGDNRHIPGFEDFARYQSGEMSFEEQHAFEKQMLEDPALAEAFEGYLLLNPSTEQYKQISNALSDQLSARLTQKKNQARPLWYYSAAASLIILAGLSWPFISQNKTIKPASQEVSLAEKQAVFKSAPAPPAAAEPAYNAPPQEDAKTPVAAAAPAQVAPVTVGKPEQAAEKSFQAATQTDDAEERIAAAEGVREQVVVPSAAPARILADEADTFSSKKIAESARVARAASPVRLSAMSQSMRRDSLSPTPGIGWEAYQQYLDKQTRSSKPEVVTIRFTVTSSGTLQNFVTTAPDSLGQRSIKLIQEGPAWKPARRDNAPISAPIQLELRFKK